MIESCQPDCSFFFTFLVKRDKRLNEIARNESEELANHFLGKKIICYCLCSNILCSFQIFHKEQIHLILASKMLTGWKRSIFRLFWHRKLKIPSSVAWCHQLWRRHQDGCEKCVTPISISNQEFLFIVKFVSSLPYKGCNSNWK